MKRDTLEFRDEGTPKTDDAVIVGPKIDVVLKIGNNGLLTVDDGNRETRVVIFADRLHDGRHLRQAVSAK